MSKRSLVAVLSFLMLFISSNAMAESGRFGVAVKASTLGAGVELITRISPNINGRLGGNAFSYDYDGTESDIEYDLELDLRSVSAILDWHPFSGGFRLSGGLLLNKNEVNAVATPTVSYDIGGTLYTATDVGTLSGKIDFNSLAPYAGIGWGNALGEDKRWGLAFDLGVVFQGSPDADLTATGPLAANAAFLAELAKEEQQLQDEVDDYEYYPVVSIGVTYKF